MNWIPIIVILALIASGTIILRRVKRVKSYGPFNAYYTKKGTTLINRIAQISPRFWKGFSTFGIIIGILGMAYIFFALIQSTLIILKTPEAAPGAVLVIPGVTVPFWSGIIALIIVLVFHEFSHGIVARAEKVKVKNVGTLSLGFIPLGAFVEPDKKQLKKAKLLTQLRVYAAGSFMNIVVGLFIILATTYLLVPALTTTNPEGIYLGKLDAGGPAELAGLKEGVLIQEMNGVPIVKTADILGVAEGLKPGDELGVGTSGGTSNIILGTKEGGKAYMGIQIIACDGKIMHPVCMPTHSWVPANLFWSTIGVLAWVILLNLGIGMFNLIPVKPFDGGYILELLSKRYAPKVSTGILLSLSTISIFLVLVNVVGPYVWKMFM